MKYYQLFSNIENKSVPNDDNMIHNKELSSDCNVDLYNDNKTYQRVAFGNLSKYNNEYVLDFHHHVDIALQAI